MVSELENCFILQATSYDLKYSVLIFVKKKIYKMQYLEASIYRTHCS